MPLRRSPRAPGEPAIACVILAFGAPRQLPAAVRSALAQEPAMEVVVVASGPGDARLRLARAGLEVPVVASAHRLLPGGSRNAGIAATGAPFVGFLAADALAESGWSAGRLARHRAGAAAVACAVTNPFPRNPFAWASHLLLFARRLPGTPEPLALRYGLSYARSVFERHGGFREDLRSGEDTELNSRLRQDEGILWAPEVRSTHHHPRTPLGLVADQTARGRRSAVAWSQLGGPHAGTVARYALTRVRSSLALGWRHVEPGQRRWVVAAAPWIPCGALAYAAGASSAAGRSEVR